MRRNLLNSTALTTTTAGALAAMGLSAAVAGPASSTRTSWTGCYVGLNVGGVSGSVDQSVFLPASVNQLFADSGSSTGFTGGGQVGCNWQAVPQYWVWGVEGDINYANVKRSQSGSGRFLGEDTALTQETKLRWMATLRGRFGATLNATLFYVTGGLALGDVSSKVNGTVTDPTGDSTATFLGSYSKVRTGWVVGGGVEHKFSDRWSGKIEYLHFDLGSFSYDVNLTQVVGNPLRNGIPTTWQANGQMNGDIVRVGFNYKFQP